MLNKRGKIRQVLHNLYHHVIILPGKKKNVLRPTTARFVSCKRHNKLTNALLILKFLLPLNIRD